MRQALVLIGLLGMACAPAVKAPAPAVKALPSGEAVSHGECLALVAWDAQVAVEYCEVSAVALGRARRVSVTTRCNGESCSVEDYVVLGDGEAIHMPSGGGHLIVDPTMQFAVFDTVDLERDLAGRERMGKWEIYVTRLELATGASARLADCMSPALSPGGEWIVCRDQEGSVYRAGIDGGPWQAIHQVDSAADEHIDWVPYAGVYPDAVTFPAADRMQVVTVLVGEAGWRDQVDELPWRE